jgi:YVTN family beta-propeller protein
MHSQIRTILISAVITAGVAMIAQQPQLFKALKSTTALGRQEEGFSLVPTNQLLHPWGQQAMLAGRPVDMAFDSDKRFLAVLNWRSILLLDGASGNKLGEIPSKSTSYAGIAFRPGNRELWASETTRNGPDSILVAKISETGSPGETTRIELKGHPVPAGLAFSADGKMAYVAFSRSNTLAAIDVTTHEIIKQVEVGIAPFGVAVSAARGRIFVTNRGGRRPRSSDPTAPSSGSAVVTDAATGSAMTGTISIVDIKTLSVREAPAGLAPSQLALSEDEKLLAVANGHSDSVTLLDMGTLAATELRIPAFPEAPLGSQPIALAFTSDAKTLYVACGGNNAIAVAQRSGAQWSVAGALPTAWFPSAVAVDREGALRVLNVKGMGNTADKKGTFNSRQYEGSLQRIPAPTPAQLAAGTREVIAANSPVYDPAGGIANLSSLGIQHVFLIVKENRTYDQVLGDIAKANGDPKLVMYGRDITPNHHALAERYVVLDNFYASGAVSFDGHHWLMQAFASDYVERALAASPRGYAYNMADSLTVAPTGFFWQGATKPLDVRLYGEIQVPARWDASTQNAVDMDEKDLLSWGAYMKLYREGKWQNAVGARGGPGAAAVLRPAVSLPVAQHSRSDSRGGVPA